MKSVLYAIAWETVTRSSLVHLLMVVLANAMPLFVLTALAGYKVDFNEDTFLPLQVGLSGTTIFLLATGVLTAQGSLKRFYLKPISSQQIVAYFYIPSLLLVALEASVSVFLWNWLYGMNWPIIYPALAAVSVIAVFQPTGHPTITRLRELGVLIAVSVLLLLWHSYRAGLWSEVKKIPTNSINFLDLLVLVCLVLGSYWVTVYRVVLDRHHGPRVGMTKWILSSWWERFAESRRSFGKHKPFRSAIHAQTWYDWSSRTQWLVYFLAVLIVLTIALVSTANLFEQINVFKVLLAACPFLLGIELVIAFLLGLIWSLENWSDKSQRIELLEMGDALRTMEDTHVKCFFKTLPISSGDLSESLLWACGRSVLCVGLGLSGFTGVCYWFSGSELSGEFSKILEAKGWLLIATFLGPWIVLANSFLLGAKDRAWKIVSMVMLWIGILFALLHYPLVVMTGLNTVLLGLLAWSLLNKRTYEILSVGKRLASVGLAVIIFMVLCVSCPRTLDETTLLCILAISLLTVMPILRLPFSIHRLRHNV